MKKQFKVTLAAIFTAIVTTVFIAACTKTKNSTPAPTPAPSNPCAGVTCFNGGSCSGGICVCPTGWTGTYCQTAVAPASKGEIQFVNNSSNPYYIYISGVLQTTLPGMTYITYSVNVGSYTCRVLQKSGYAVYPTDQSYTANVTKGGTAVVSFP